MGVTGFESIQNCVQHPLSVAKHLVVPKSQHSEALAGELAVALQVISLTLRMLSAVELEHELRFEACEVRYEACDRHLAPEAVPAELPVPDLAPETAFSVSRLIAKDPGALLKERITHRDHYPAAPTPTLPRAPGAGEGTKKPS